MNRLLLKTKQQGRIKKGGECEFLHQKGLGIWHGISFTKKGGTIQGFETPNIIWGILKHPKIIIGVRGGKCGFFTPEGVRRMPGVYLTKS